MRARLWLGSFVGSTMLTAMACVGDDPSVVTGSTDAGVDVMPDTPDTPADATIDAADAATGERCEQPCDVATGQSQPHGIAVDATHVYWTNRSVPGSVLRKPKVGSQIETLAAGQDAPTGIAVTPAYVYWLTTSPPRVARRALSGAPPETGVAAVDKPKQLAVAGGRVFYTGETADGGMGRGLHSVSDVLDMPEALDPAIDARALAFDGTVASAYYARYGTTTGVIRVRQAGGDIFEQQGINATAVEWKGVHAIAVADAEVYWTSLDGVFRQSKATFGLAAAYATPVSTIVDARGIVFDSARKRAFFVTSGGSVYRADGSAVDKIGEAACEAEQLAQDETSLYWTCGSLGTVKRMLKP